MERCTVHYMDEQANKAMELSISNLSQAIFTVNRHAKTALNPKYLYILKKNALNKMIQEQKATKIGLHFSRNPKCLANNNQMS